MTGKVERHTLNSPIDGAQKCRVTHGESKFLDDDLTLVAQLYDVSMNLSHGYNVKYPHRVRHITMQE